MLIFASSTNEDWPMAAIFPPPGHAQVERASTRASKPPVPHGAGILVCEGHGEWVAAAGIRPDFEVPPGFEIVIYQGEGGGMDDAHGVQIGRGQGMPARIPTIWDNDDEEYSTDTAGVVRKNTPGRRVYRWGERCPDYTLYAYNEPGFPAITAPQPGSYHVAINAPQTLHAICGLFDGQQGVQIHWAACTLMR
jgi:hypothetical protein